MNRRSEAHSCARFSPVIPDDVLKGIPLGLVENLGFRVSVLDGDTELLLDRVQVPVNLDLRAVFSFQ